MIQRKQRTMDNANFERYQENIFKKAERGTEHEGQISEMDKFVQFWGGIWEKDNGTPKMPWMESVRD